MSATISTADGRPVAVTLDPAHSLTKVEIGGRFLNTNLHCVFTEPEAEGGVTDTGISA
jgi:hypothetical protein